MRPVWFGILAMLLMIVVGTHVWGGAVPNLWAHTVARTCEPDTSVRYCFASVSARVTESTTTTVTLAAADRGVVRARLSPADAERLALTADDTVRLTVLADEVVTATAANGERATARRPPGT